MGTAVGVGTSHSKSKLPTYHFQNKVAVNNQDYYFKDSFKYKIGGGFSAEVIHHPGDKFIEAGIIEKVQKELSYVAIMAFRKEMDEIDTYVPQNVISKNAIWVDWLVIVRKNKIPVAFGSATYLTPFLLYLSSAMVLPVEQPTGVGVLANALLWKLAVEEAVANGVGAPEIVCRTHNKNVASVMLHVLREVKISTENTTDLEEQKIFIKTANHLNCNYNFNTGISYNVYPEGLPFGTKISNERISEAFKDIGPSDACYISGKLNSNFIEKLLSKKVSADIPEESEVPYTLNNLIPVFV